MFPCSHCTCLLVIAFCIAPRGVTTQKEISASRKDLKNSCFGLLFVISLCPGPQYMEYGCTLRSWTYKHLILNSSNSHVLVWVAGFHRVNVALRYSILPFHLYYGHHQGNKGVAESFFKGKSGSSSPFIPQTTWLMKFALFSEPRIISLKRISVTDQSAFFVPSEQRKIRLELSLPLVRRNEADDKSFVVQWSLELDLVGGKFFFSSSLYCGIVFCAHSYALTGGRKREREREGRERAYVGELCWESAIKRERERILAILSFLLCRSGDMNERHTKRERKKDRHFFLSSSWFDPNCSSFFSVRTFWAVSPSALTVTKFREKKTSGVGTWPIVLLMLQSVEALVLFAQLCLMFSSHSRNDFLSRLHSGIVWYDGHAFLFLHKTNSPNFETATLLSLELWD